VTSEKIISELRKIMRALNVESKRIQKNFGVSIPQLLCLIYLSRARAYQATTKTLSEELSLNPSTISGIISRLEKKGYVARLPKRDDKRITHITLTAEGAKLIKSSPILFHQRLDDRLSMLSAQQLNEVERGLQLITEILGLSDWNVAPMLTFNHVEELGEFLDEDDEYNETIDDGQPV